MVLVMHTEEDDTVLHIEKTAMLMLVVKVDVGCMTAGVVDKFTCSSDDVKPRQVGLRSAHASTELHWHDTHVDPDRHEVDQRFKYKHDYTVTDSPRAVIFQDKYGVQMMMRFNEIHKFSDGTLQQIDEALDYRVKEFRINRLNSGLNTRFWTMKDVDRCKAIMFAIQRRLRTRRIFCNLESFVGGCVRDGDYRLLKLTTAGTRIKTVSESYYCQYKEVTAAQVEEVIENGATLPKTYVVEGVTKEITITTVEKKAQRRLEVKARSTLMMGIPNKHQLKFNSIKDAKQLLEAVEKRFEMLDQTFDRLQKLRNKADLDTMSMDDLYNNLKVYEPEVKRMSSSNSNTYNMAFLSSTNSSTNGAVNTALLLKRRFLKKTGRKLSVNGNETYGFDMSKVECYNCHKRGHFARECKAPRNQDNKHKESTRMSVPMETPASTALVSCDVPPLYIGNFMPPKPDLSFTGLDKFAVKPVVENKSSEEETKAVRKNTGALIIEEWVSNDEEKNVTQSKIVKKTVRPNIVKKEFVKPRQQEKPARKTIKKVEHNRKNTHRPRGNQRN
nr:hypothetical protein [Tanacetum cinerariifolium]